MDNKPKALTDDEINEIAAIEDIREMWGAETPADMALRLRHDIYAVRFDFISGGPGYVGDLFILIDEPETPLILIRKNGALKITDLLTV